MQMKNCCYKFGGLKFDCFCLKGYTYSEDRVAYIVRDGNLVTSRGPGTAFEFGIELVRAVRGDDGEAEKLAGPMLIK
ncbi:Protein deglycase DJ-1zDJ-1 [Porites harrisoni]